MDNLKFGNFVRKLRTENNLTQKNLAQQLNITDKAISKWERGLSFPDIEMLESISAYFNVSISELLNGERGAEKSLDIDKEIEQAVAKALSRENERKLKKDKIIKIISSVSTALFALLFLFQCSYYIFSNLYSFEYKNDIIVYVINTLIVVFFILSIFLHYYIKNQNAILKFAAALFALLLAVGNFIFIYNNGFNNKCITSYSSDFSNQLILKQNVKTGKITLFRPYFLFFAKEKEQLPDESNGNIKTQWITNNVCSITYVNPSGKLCEYISTYSGNQNAGYNYVSNAIYGQWKFMSQNNDDITLRADSKGITILFKGIHSFYNYSQTKQFGVSAIVLYNGLIPEYVVALNDDCKIDATTGYIKNGGTLSLQKISMKKTMSIKLDCITHKDENLNKYSIIDMDAETYKVENGIIYFSYDGENVIEVPGEYNGEELDKNNWQISKIFTFFLINNSKEKKIIESADGGLNWQEYAFNLPLNTSINSLHFINDKTGYMLVFTDVAMSSAYGKIMKTEDGGKSWFDLFYGIGENEYKSFSIASKLKFFSDKVGFLTMPDGIGESCNLYETTNGGKTFNLIDIKNVDDYDYFNIPVLNNNSFYLEVGKGSDGDNFNDKIAFVSDDFGVVWNRKY